MDRLVDLREGRPQGCRRPEVVMRRPAVLLLSIIALALTACEGTVTDPVGDHESGGSHLIDIVEVGVDYGTGTTRFWVRFVEGGGPSEGTGWNVSTDGDTDPEVSVRIGAAYYPPPGGFDHYSVYINTDGGAELMCSGFVDDRGFDGIDTTSLTIDTRCIAPPGDTGPPNAIRVSGQTASGRYGHDWSDYTAPVARS
jgi:hypothetical protein